MLKQISKDGLYEWKDRTTQTLWKIQIWS